MALTPGKQFESDIKKSIPKDWFYYRLKDSAGSWSNTGVSRFTPSNSCDLFIFTGSMLFGVELKSFQGKSMPYSNIKKKQLEDLTAMSDGLPLNAQGIFILNFRDLNETYMVNTCIVHYLKDTSGRKSIGIEEARVNGILIPQVLKRVHYRYNLKALKGE